MSVAIASSMIGSDRFDQEEVLCRLPAQAPDDHAGRATGALGRIRMCASRPCATPNMVPMSSEAGTLSRAFSHPKVAMEVTLDAAGERLK
jgi:hypothetical protein